jgi:hypothetical protein
MRRRLQKQPVWLLTVVAAIAIGLIGWGVPTAIDRPAQYYTEADLILRDLDLAQEQYDLTLTIMEAFATALQRSAGRHEDSASSSYTLLYPPDFREWDRNGQLRPDWPARIREWRDRDSVRARLSHATAAYHKFATETAMDSVRLASLEALPLSPPQGRAVTSILASFGAERRYWMSHSALLARSLEEIKVADYEYRDSLFQAAFAAYRSAATSNDIAQTGASESLARSAHWLRSVEAEMSRLVNRSRLVRQRYRSTMGFAFAAFLSGTLALGYVVSQAQRRNAATPRKRRGSASSTTAQTGSTDDGRPGDAPA